MGIVITCYKSVIDENDITVSSDGTASFARAKRKIGDYEKNALEAGNQLAAAMGAKAIALTYATDESSQQVKDALSRGAAEAVTIIDDAAEVASARMVGKAIAAAIAKTEDVSVVITADGSSDAYHKQTGARIAADLDWPYVGNAIQLIPDGEKLTVVQKADGAVRRICVSTPAVVSVLPEICAAKTPGMRDILAAKKKPQTTYSPADLGVSADETVQAEAMRGFVMERKNIVFDGTADEAVSALVDALKKEGVLA